jgi:hypothetical protein
MAVSSNPTEICQPARWNLRPCPVVPVLRHRLPDTLNPFRRLRPRTQSAVVLASGEPVTLNAPDGGGHASGPPPCFWLRNVVFS